MTLSWQLLICFIALYSCSDVFAEGQGCTWYAHGDVPTRKDPVMLVYDGNKLVYAVPRGSGNDGAIRLATNQELIVSCPGDGNYIKATREQTSVGICKSDKTLIVGGKEYELEDLKCDEKTQASAKNTGVPCADGEGVLVELGYTADGIGWRKLIESCHHMKGSFTYYSKHTLYGTAIGSRNWQWRPSFITGGPEFYPGIDPEHAYSWSNQKAVLGKIVGAKHVSDYFKPLRFQYIVRGHLAPNADFLFGSWQTASFFYLNTAPQWQVINTGSWVDLEKKVRDFAERDSIDLEVATGTYGVMELEGEEINLAECGRLPAPELFWKIIRRPSDNACIAFISTNNPFLKAPPNHLCSDVCHQYNWQVGQSDLRKGYVYCCDYGSIKAAIPYVPEMACQSVISYS